MSDLPTKMKQIIVEVFNKSIANDGEGCESNCKSQLSAGFPLP